MESFSFSITCSYRLHYKPNLIGGKFRKKSRYNNLVVKKKQEEYSLCYFQALRARKPMTRTKENKNQQGKNERIKGKLRK
jgi:hypothetical protein